MRSNVRSQVEKCHRCHRCHRWHCCQCCHLCTPLSLLSLFSSLSLLSLLPLLWPLSLFSLLSPLLPWLLLSLLSVLNDQAIPKGWPPLNTGLTVSVFEFKYPDLDFSTAGSFDDYCPKTLQEVNEMILKSHLIPPRCMTKMKTVKNTELYA